MAIPNSKPTKKRETSDEGFTLMEVVIAVSLMAILGTLSLTAYAGYAKTQEHRGAVREVASILRNLQIRSVTEAQTYQCVFQTSSVPNRLVVYRSSGNPPPSGAQVQTFTLRSSLRFEDVKFVHSDPSYPESVCLFFPRGSASKGGFGVTRIDNNRAYQVAVESLTARVSFSEVIS